MASFYGGNHRTRQGADTRIRIDVDYSRTGATGYNVTVKLYLECTNWSNSCPFYAYSTSQNININGNSANQSNVNPNANWTRSVYLWERTVTVDPGGPAYNCSVAASYGVPSGTYTYSSYTWHEVSGTITLPSTWVKPGQTYVTRITNNTSGTVKNSGDQAIDSTWWGNGNDNANYAGDSLTLWWDKNNQASVGTNADPTSRAFFTRDIDNNHDEYDTLLLQPWDWTGGGGDLSNSSSYTISNDDCNRWLKCMMYKSMLNSSGTRQHYLQGALEYVKPQPSHTISATMRSKRFYKNTPSMQVYRVNTVNITSNGYGVAMLSNNGTSNTYVNNNTVSASDGVFSVNNSRNGEGTAGFRWGTKAFNANYSLPSTPLDFHGVKETVNFTPVSDSLIYYNWFNPKNKTGRRGWLGEGMGRLSVVNGSITLPTIDEIKPISGNGTTAIVDSTKHVWTNQANVKLTYKVTHSGNNNGFGYDARVTGNSGTYASSNVYGATSIPIQIDYWKSPYGVIDNTADTVMLQHDNTTTAGSVRQIMIVPYIKDGDGYQIFGAANTSNGAVTSTAYTVYRIQAPNVPTLNTWSNTLPAIDGVKDRVQWKITSPSSFGNVTDFTTGFKLKYRIGADKTRADGYEWYFTEGAKNTSEVFTGYFDETYDRSLNTVCDAMVAATNRYSTVWNAYLDFQSAYTAAKSYNITAKTPYKQTVGTIDMNPTGGNHTVLNTEVPFTFTCPNQSSLNATDLVRTTTMIIDGDTPIVIEDPVYTLGTANSLTGLRTVTWTALKSQTTTLARGAHTIKVECEVLSYFKSTAPIENNVYLGATKVSSPVMNIEVAELPQKPTMKTPTPAYYEAGQERTMTFPWTTNDWGCLDTANNNRHFEYQLVNPSGTIISSGTITKDKTSWSYTFTPNNNNLGTYTFKLRESTVVGNSDYATQTFQILKAVEPDQANITTSQVIALDGWNWNLKVVPGSNGSFKPVTTTPITRYKVDIIRPGYNMYNPSFKKLDSQITALSDGWYKITGNNISTAIDYIDFWTNFNSHLKADTAYTYVIEIRNATINNAHENAVHISIGKTGGQIGSWADYDVDSDTFTQLETGTTLTIPDTSPNGTYFIPVRTKKDMKSLGGSNYSTPTDNSMMSRDFFTLYVDDDYSLEFRISLVEGEITEADFEYKAYQNPFVQNIVSWTNANNGATINRDLTHNFGQYTDGTYWLEIEYDRNYTTKTTRDIMHTQIIPPEVNISDLSYVVSNEVTENTIPFMINMQIFASTTEYKCYYSLDYENTWIEIPLTETDMAERYFRKKLPLGYLDTVIIKAVGSNPVDSETYITQHEMPTSYKVWLSYANRGSEDMMLPNRYPKKYSTVPSLNMLNPVAGDTVSWDHHSVKYSTSDTASSANRGFYIADIGTETGMVNGKKYRLTFKARATEDHKVNANCECIPGSSKSINLTKQYQTFYIEGTYSTSTSYRALTFYSNLYQPKERVYVKDIRVSEIKPALNQNFIRRVSVSHSGQPSKKVRHVSKK